MSYLEHNLRRVPSGPAKILYLNWGLLALVIAAAGIGWLMLYSVAGGSAEPWAGAHATRFGAAAVLMMGVALVPIWFWRNMSVLAYLAALGLLVFVEVRGAIGMGAQRWIDLGVMRLQPSELMKLALVMVLAAYYDWLSLARVSRPLAVLAPAALIALPVLLTLRQPDLGTAVLLAAGGGAVMFVAGVHWLYFAILAFGAIGLVAVVLTSRGTEWQLLSDYQYKRIDIFLDPGLEPLGAGYHITHSKIALSSGGWGGRGFMQGTQSRLDFLPENHTDFIFASLGEEFGFVGSLSILAIYVLIVVFCIIVALRTPSRFAALVTLGIAVTFFLFFAVNMAMVMGLVPVVGVPLPLVSYGGSAMLVLMLALGIVQSAHIHRPR
ncbi:MAG: rod shape-determining protein RodA [Rhodobacteraceae bacterium]|jgi:rod shape determining protein RodA|nr:rod shape-determining protein RodA [Paracoccaceae bacterium]